MRKFIANEGMPQYKNPFKKGRLIIEFDVEYPQDGSFDESIRQKLFSILDHQPNLEEQVKEHDDIPHYTLTNVNEVEEQMNKRNQTKDPKTGDVYNSDEEEQEEHFGTQTTSCRFM